MTQILVFREQLKEIYSEYSRWIDATLRFVFAFFAMTVINLRMGYVDSSDGVLAIVALSLLCAVMPVGMSFVASFLFIVFNLTKISMLLALVFVCIGLLMYLLYFSFKPGNAYAATLGLGLGLLGLYAPVSMIIALLASPIALIPALFGVIIAGFVGYIDVNYAILVSPDHASNSIKQVITIAKGVVLDESMWKNCFFMVIIVLVVYLLRRLFFKNNWLIAIFSGAFLYMVLALLMSLNDGLMGQGLMIFANTVLALICGLVLHFFVFMVDASRVEHVQFEDDDYYYYVKVVPKVRVSTPEVRVTKINSHKVKDAVKLSEDVTFVSDEVEKENTLEEETQEQTEEIIQNDEGEEETLC